MCVNFWWCVTLFIKTLVYFVDCCENVLRAPSGYPPSAAYMFLRNARWCISFFFFTSWNLFVWGVVNAPITQDLLPYSPTISSLPTTALHSAKQTQSNATKHAGTDHIGTYTKLVFAEATKNELDEDKLVPATSLHTLSVGRVILDNSLDLCFYRS